MTYSHDVLLPDSRAVIDFFMHNPWFRTHTIFDASGGASGGMLFRGQADSRWKLTPSAFRPGQLSGFTPQPPPSTELAQIPRRRHLGYQLHAELRAVQLFLNHADALGIPTPIDFTTVSHGMDVVVAALNDNPERDYTAQFPDDSFQRATALAQHHGVPTRFLDWSESPLIACYFAAYAASSFSPCPLEPGQEIAIIFLSGGSLYPAESPINLVRAPRHENSHMLQQRGVFTSMRNANSYFLEHGLWPSLDVYASSSVQIHRVRLCASKADELLRHLYDMNITRQSLMPTLDFAASAFSYSKVLFGNQ